MEQSRWSVAILAEALEKLAELYWPSQECVEVKD